METKQDWEGLDVRRGRMMVSQSISRRMPRFAEPTLGVSASFSSTYLELQLCKKKQPGLSANLMHPNVTIWWWQRRLECHLMSPLIHFWRSPLDWHQSYRLHKCVIREEEKKLWNSYFWVYIHVKFRPKLSVIQHLTYAFVVKAEWLTLWRMDLKNATMEHLNDLIIGSNQDIHCANELMAFLLSPLSSNASNIQGKPERFPDCGSSLVLLILSWHQEVLEF